MSSGPPVIVAGAGAAGLVAALAAAEPGARVIVVESNPRFDRACTTTLSNGLIPAAGTPQQLAAGVQDSPDRFAEDVQRKAGGAAPPELLSSLTAASAEVIGWLGETLSSPIKLAVDTDYPGHSASRLHGLPERSGAILHRRLRDRVEAHESIDLAVPVAIRRIGETESGLEVTLCDRDGAESKVIAGAVVLATGGFAQSPERMAKHIPQLADITYFGGDGNDGTALDLAHALNLDTAALDSFTAHASYAVDHGVLVTWNMVMHGGIIVDANGLRFADETAGYSQFAMDLASRPGRFGFVLFDSDILDRCRGFPEVREIEAAGGFTWAEDGPQLAAQVGVRSEVLEDTLAHVSHATLGQCPDAFGRLRWPHRLAFPMTALRIAPILGFTQGGISTDPTGCALRAGDPVRGLYAAGGAAAGVSGHGGEGYMAGNGMMMAVVLGYLAGRDAGQVALAGAGSAAQWKGK